MSHITEIEVANCYHCGDICKDSMVQKQDKIFCCQGCETVYEILQENDLCSYYDFEKNPGVSLKGRSYGNKFDYLANDEIIKTLLDYQSEGINKINLYIPSVHCSSCIWLLENLYKLKDGISASRIDFIKKELTLSYNPSQVTLKQIVELLATLGYEPDISLENYGKKAERKSNRSIFLKLGITGFCTGNIMALSFPEYFGLEHVGDQEFRTFVTWLNLILSQPILFYGASGYFISAYHSLKIKTINLDVPLSIGIFTIYARSLFETLAGIGPGYWDSFSGLVFLLLIGKWLQHKTYENLSFDRSFKSYFPLAATKVENKKPVSVPVTELQIGDRIQIRNQELVPADSILLSPIAWIDYSFVTGESDPVEKKVGEYIYAGGRQVGKLIDLQVNKPVSQSYLTQLWNSDAFEKKKGIPMTRLASQFSRYFTIITIFLAVSSAIYWYFIAPAVMWNAFTAVLIVACPCALSLAMPFTMENTMRVFGRNRFYVKSPDVIQHMATISHIVFDKTGTLTENKSSRIVYEGNPLDEKEWSYVKSLVTNSTHPLSQKINNYLTGIKPLFVEDYVESPGSGLKGMIAGNTVRMGSSSFLGVTEEPGKDSSVLLQINGQLKGNFKFTNTYRQGIASVLNRLFSHFKLFLISGDKKVDVGELAFLFKGEKNLNFNQQPIDKLNFIKGKQEEGEKVMMIGDGLNDAGALKQSDVGMVLSDDVHAFFPACDVLADANEFKKLPDIIRFSKTSVNLVKVSFLLSLVYNFIALSMAVSGLLSPVFAAIFMPLSSISVVAFAVGSTALFARIRGL